VSFAALGKKIAQAAKEGKDLNKIDLGKYGTATAAKRDKLAKAVKDMRKGSKTQAKKLARHPEKFTNTKRTFITDTERQKMGYPIGTKFLGPRTNKNYRRGGKVRGR
tara:strand:+ start:378 stop:698 length:321 start_codon:yes stop_codon:yes gene_type:complete